MKGAVRWPVLALLLALSLTACGLPQSRETENTAVLGVLGVEPSAGGLRVYGGAESREDQAAAVYVGWGETPAQGVEDLAVSGEAVVSCAHVEHLLLAQTAAGALEAVLDYGFQDLQQSTESQLWVVQTADLSQVFRSGSDLPRRMSVLQAAGEGGRCFVPVTLREAAAAVAAGEPLLLPVLEVSGGSLTLGGYTIYKDGAFPLRLTGEAALGVALLRGESICWTAAVGERAVSLRSVGRQAAVRWQGDVPAAVSVCCRLEGAGSLSPVERQALEGQVARSMTAALRAMQQAELDGTGLQKAVGLQHLLQWPKLSRTWEGAFPALAADLTAEIAREGAETRGGGL